VTFLGIVYMLAFSSEAQLDCILRLLKQCQPFGRGASSGSVIDCPGTRMGRCPLVGLAALMEVVPKPSSGPVAPLE
jgi:hypothetical protein